MSEHQSRDHWISIVRELGPAFAARAAAHDGDDSFVADNYKDLRARRLFSAGVPAELGGGGAPPAGLGRGPPAPAAPRRPRGPAPSGDAPPRPLPAARRP